MKTLDSPKRIELWVESIPPVAGARAVSRFSVTPSRFEIAQAEACGSERSESLLGRRSSDKDDRPEWNSRTSCATGYFVDAPVVRPTE